MTMDFTMELRINSTVKDVQKNITRIDDFLVNRMEMTKIRTETKIIRQLLKELYPNDKFMLSLRQPSSYVYNSDKIIIKCPDNIDKQDVIMKLKKHVFGISVYEKGSFGSILNINSTPSVCMLNGDEMDMDMVEFIEVV